MVCVWPAVVLSKVALVQIRCVGMKETLCKFIESHYPLPGVERKAADKFLSLDEYEDAVGFENSALSSVQTC